MTIAELISELQKLPPNLRVCVRGYEGGINEISSINRTALMLGYYAHDNYYGRHREVEDWDDQEALTESEIVEAVELVGRNK